MFRLPPPPARAPRSRSGIPAAGARLAHAAVAAVALGAVAGCGPPDGRQDRRGARVGSPLARQGDEIVVAGQFIHTGAPVVLWLDPGGYDAYRLERRFPDAPAAVAAAARSDAPDAAQRPAGTREGSPDGPDESPRRPSQPRGIGRSEAPATLRPRFDLRSEGLSSEELQRVRGGGWDLPLLQRVVDLFVIHYDACGVSRECFRVLHDQRGLSVHFMIDIDGTVYQTLDVKERAWHAGEVNSRSVGVELANRGAYEPGRGDLERWYVRETDGRTRLRIPDELGDGGVRTPGFIARPARDRLITGRIGTRTVAMYDFTPQQYDSLIGLTAALCTVLPRIRCDYPRGPDGTVLTRPLTPAERANFSGLVGHFHVTEVDRKQDPGPAFQWEMVVREARRRMGADADGPPQRAERP